MPQYGSHESDGTGLYYYRARYYSPVLQRYISEDPIGFGGGDTNLYRYVGNNPHAGSDATGTTDVATLSGGVSTSFGGAEDAFNRNSSPFVQSFAARDSFIFSTGGGGVVRGGVLGGGGRDGTLVAFAPALVVAPVVVDVAIAVGAAALFRAGLTYITGPGPQPALDGSVFSSEGQAAERKPLLGSDPQRGRGGTRTNTRLLGGRAAAKSIFRKLTKGQRVKDFEYKNGGVRREAEDGTQIRLDPDGSARLELPNRGPRGRGETAHFQ